MLINRDCIPINRLYFSFKEKKIVLRMFFWDIFNKGSFAIRFISLKYNSKKTRIKKFS